VVSAGDPEHDGGNESGETEFHLVRTTDFSTVVLAKDNISNHYYYCYRYNEAQQ
jgi:hypothetical protein